MIFKGLYKSELLNYLLALSCSTSWGMVLLNKLLNDSLISDIM